MANAKYTFLRQVPASFMQEKNGVTRLTIPGDKASANGRVSIQVSPDQVFPTADKDGNIVPKHSNIRLEAGSEVEVTYVDETGNTVKGTRTAEQLSNAWMANQREYAKQQGQKVWLNGVSPDMIHESKVELKDGSGRHMMNVSVADPASMAVNGREQGYGSFLVSPDAISDTQAGDKKNIYLGREKDGLSGYSICTGIDENGKPTYGKVQRTAGDVKKQYEDDIAAYKERQGAKAGPEAAGPEAPGSTDAPDF